MRSSWALALGLALVAGPIASGASPSEIQRAVDQYLALPDRESRFIVIEHPATGKYVQFEFDGGDLIIDLPVIALDEREQRRALALFGSVGIDAPTEYSYRNEESGPTLAITTWRRAFGTDAVAASAFAERIVREVYVLPADAAFVVTEGSR